MNNVVHCSFLCWCEAASVAICFTYPHTHVYTHKPEIPHGSKFARHAGLFNHWAIDWASLIVQLLQTMRDKSSAVTRHNFWFCSLPRPLWTQICCRTVDLGRPTSSSRCVGKLSAVFYRETFLYIKYVHFIIL
jgi:hypothetical protein